VFINPKASSPRRWWPFARLAGSVISGSFPKKELQNCEKRSDGHDDREPNQDAIRALSLRIDGQLVQSYPLEKVLDDVKVLLFSFRLFRMCVGLTDNVRRQLVRLLSQFGCGFVPNVVLVRRIHMFFTEPLSEPPLVPTNAGRLISGGGADNESKLAAISISYRIMSISALPPKADRHGGLSLDRSAAYLS
jgi:hypothetical protein